MKSEKLLELARSHLENPTKEMSIAFKALRPELQWILFALLDTRIYQYRIDTSNVSARLSKSYRRLFQSEPSEEYHELLGELSEGFIEVDFEEDTIERVDWIHPSYRDLAIFQLSKQTVPRTRFLEKCSNTGLKIALSVAGGTTGKLHFPLARSESDWETISRRIVSDSLSSSSLVRIVIDSYDSAVSPELSIPQSQIENLCDVIRALWLSTIAPQEPDWLHSISGLKLYYELRTIVDSDRPSPSPARIFQEIVDEIESSWFSTEFDDTIPKPLLQISELTKTLLSEEPDTHSRLFESTCWRSASRRVREFVVQTSKTIEHIDDSLDQLSIEEMITILQSLSETFLYIPGDDGDTLDNYTQFIGKVDAAVSEYEGLLNTWEPDEREGHSDSQYPPIKISELFSDL